MPIKNNSNKIETDLETFIENIPDILDETDILTEAFFKKLKKYVNFDNCFVYFLSTEGLTSVYPSAKFINIIDTTIIKSLFEEKLENLKDISDKNHLITYLKVKGVIFGILLFEKNTFTDREKLLLKTLTKIVSYKIKDKELSEIINSQLKELAKALTTTKKAEKIKTDFISNVSHELRTPLNAIIGFSELLKNPKVGELNTKQKNYIQNIHKASLQLLGMINEILDISKIESNTIQLIKHTFEIKQALEEVLTILYPLFEEKNIKVTQHIENIDIKADYQKIKQIFFNLLSNAIKYTKNEIKIGIYQENKQIIIKIKDNGIGIEKKYHKNIFKKFTQLSNNSKIKETSTGLGLTITKEFVKLHNGTIELNSEPNNGAEFIIKLPLN